MQPGWHWGPAFKVFFAMWSITRKSEAQQWRLGKVCARERGAGTLSVSPPAPSSKHLLLIQQIVTKVYTVQSARGAVPELSLSAAMFSRVAGLRRCLPAPSGASQVLR